MMNRFVSLMFFASLCTPLAASRAEEGHADVFVGRPASGTQTQIGAAFVPDELNTTDRVFEGDLGVDLLGGTNNIYFATEPGFFNAGSLNLLGATNPAGTLPLVPGESISLSVVPLTFGSSTAPLFYWDGVGAVNFVSTTAILTLQSVGNTADVSGALDDHRIFEIDDPASDTLPASGIYLFGLTAQLGGLDPSDNIFVLLVTGDELEHSVEAAERAVLGVPEPAPLALLALVCAIAYCARCVNR